VHHAQIGQLTLGDGHPLAFVLGPCVIESPTHALKLAEAIASIAARLNIPVVFKASYDKANRTSGRSFRGPGMDSGLQTLADIRTNTGLPVLTDVHEAWQVEAVAQVVDVIQIPAFLSRQTDLIVAAARSGKTVNVKKGQFLAPLDMQHVINKITAEGNTSVLLTERGVSFGYNNLVVDVRSFPMLRALGHPVIFDVTHSLQLPGAGKGTTTGLAKYIEPLAAAGVAAGVDGVFMEIHDDPLNAPSDAGNALELKLLEPLLIKLLRVDAAANGRTPLVELKP
jgi:2-dehydro-3-deoxyphosphooctonate aldolase (KDO 8-P synthase)